MPASFSAGMVLEGTYRIVQTLAAGGMSEVYLAEHERLASRFALKALHPEMVHDKAALSRFQREAEVMAGLRHPNIVQVFDFNVAPNGTPYLVMELLDGKDLGEVLKGEPRMSPEEVVTIVQQIARALDAAHAIGVVHRDLKPENVVLTRVDDGEMLVKVIDFGISKVRRAKRITANATLLGTPQFMSPEQAQGLRDEVDARTDQFALAAMTYLLLTGQSPFCDGDPASTLYRIVHHDPEPMANLVDWDVGPVEVVLRKALSKRRDDRYASVGHFSNALAAAVASIQKGAPSDGAASRSSANLRTRKTVNLRGALPSRTAGVAVLAAAAAAIGAFMWTRLLGPEAHMRGASSPIVIAGPSAN